jgi:polyisoprenoid-binding protein YceI
MRRIVFFLLAFILSKAAAAQYRPADEGSKVSFKVGNLGFDVPGSFTGLQGNIKFDPINPSGSNFDVTIDANTVNTNNSLRDSHLKNESYFDVKNYPRIRLVSKAISTANKNGSYTMTGQLTIKDKTLDISFPFTAQQLNDGFVFKGTFKINRKDFGVGGTSTISNEVEISLNVIAKKT